MTTRRSRQARTPNPGHSGSGQSPASNSPSKSIDSLAGCLRDLRARHGLTQEGMALLLGVGRSTYAHYETGRIRTPKGFVTRAEAALGAQTGSTGRKKAATGSTGLTRNKPVAAKNHGRDARATDRDENRGPDARATGREENHGRDARATDRDENRGPEARATGRAYSDAQLRQFERRAIAADDLLAFCIAALRAGATGQLASDMADQAARAFGVLTVIAEALGPMIERRDARALTAGCRVGEHHIDVRAFDVIGWGGSDRLTRMATQWLTRRFDATARAFVRAMEADG